MKKVRYLIPILYVLTPYVVTSLSYGTIHFFAFLLAIYSLEKIIIKHEEEKKQD